MKKKPKRQQQNQILILIIIIAILLDQITKIVAFRKGWNIIQDHNIETNNNGYYIIMTIIILIMIIRYIKNDNTFIKMDTKIILSFAIAGAIGNLIDRIWNQNVIVFINLGKNININLAYIYIIIAWIGLAAILAKNVTKILQDNKKEKVIKNEYQKNKNK